MKKYHITINRVQSESYEITANSIDEALSIAYADAYNKDWSGIEPEYNDYHEDNY